MSKMFGEKAVKERADAREYVQEKKRERANIKERALIAKVFNDKYTYIERYVPFGPNADLYTSYAWMCPACNKIHLSLSHSFLTGLQYPACCMHPEGHRLHDNIKMPKSCL